MILPGARGARTRCAVAGALLLLAAVWSLMAGGALERALDVVLTKTAPLPEGSLAGRNRNDRAVYILGGAQNDLQEKFKIAAHLYRTGASGKILVLSRPGITEYDRTLRRNLTNDEWSLKELTKVGIAEGNVEFVALEEKFFGTLTEAKGIARLARERGYRRLILITTRRHTARTWLSFSHYLRSDALALYAAHDRSALPALVTEYIKLLVYKYAVLKFA